MFGSDGELIYITHRAEDVTEYMHLKQAGVAQQKLTAELHTKTAIMESEIFKRGQELQAVNHQLRSANAEITRMFDRTRQAEDALRASEAKLRA